MFSKEPNNFIQNVECVRNDWIACQTGSFYKAILINGPE